MAGILHLVETGIPDWQDQAACQNSHPDLFFPAKYEDVRPAKRICADCPVHNQCLEYALANDEQHGIWGGTTLRERRLIKKARRFEGAA